MYPLLCPRCRIEMRIVAVITDPEVVDRILAHLARGASPEAVRDDAADGFRAARRPSRKGFVADDDPAGAIQFLIK